MSSTMPMAAVCVVSARPNPTTKLLIDAILDVYTKQVRRRTLVLTLNIITDKLLPGFSDGIQASHLTPWMQCLVLLLYAGHRWLLPFSDGYQKAQSRAQRLQHQAICRLGCHVSIPHRNCPTIGTNMIFSGRCCGGNYASSAQH